MTRPSPLDWSDDGVPRSRQFGDIYFSPEDGLAESRSVFLRGCDLPQAWRGRRTYVVAELGFGTGLNIVALMDLWRSRCAAADDRPRHLHVFSVEAFPLSRDEAARALAAFTEVTEAAQALLAVWPPAVPGLHRVSPEGWDMTLDLYVGDATEALAAWSGRADAWFLDGFAPSTNPAMWSESLLQAVADRSAPGARLATFTVAGAVRRGLTDAGFTVRKVPGFGRKRERLEATFGEPLPGSAPVPRIAVIGAGIAGASAARACAAAGLKATVFEAVEPGTGGSGFPVGLVTPRLDAGDLTLATLAAQAVRRAMALYRMTPNAICHQGVRQRPGRQTRADRFERIAAQPVWAEGEMVLLGPDAATAVADQLHADDGRTAGAPGAALNMALAGAIHPRAVLSAWLADTEIVQARVADLTAHADEGWTLCDDEARPLGHFDHIILASADGCRHLRVKGQPLDLPLGVVAGQADWVDHGAPAVTVPTAWGGYAVPFGASGLLFGATHERGVEHPQVSREATTHNLAQLGSQFPGIAAQLNDRDDLKSRVAVRAVTPDRLPLAGQMAGSPGLHLLTGFGSRGLAWAPLLAEHVVASVLGQPSPLTRAQAKSLQPCRFSERA